VSIGRLVFETGRPARIDDWSHARGVIAEAIGRLGIHSSAGAPVVVAGRLWGYMTVNSSRAEPLPASTERRLADFTDLLATAIANSEARAEIARLADEQAALRRVAMLVARGVPPSEVFAAVTEEIVGLLGAEVAGMSRYDPGDVQTVVAAWPPDREHLRVGTRLPVSDGDNIARRVLETGEPVRLDDWSATSGAVASLVRRLGVRSSVGSPIVVAGRLWGVMIVDSRAARPLPDGAEQRLASFTELVATAVANSEADRERGRLAAEQSALRRVATYVAHGLKPDDGLAVVAAEVGLLLDAEVVHLNRLDRDGAVTTVAAWSQHGNHVPAGSRWTLEGDSATALVLRTGQPARVDDYRDAPGAIAAALRQRAPRRRCCSPSSSRTTTACCPSRGATRPPARATASSSAATGRRALPRSAPATPRRPPPARSSTAAGATATWRAPARSRSSTTTASAA
jgi:GAF domain-containing protein